MFKALKEIKLISLFSTSPVIGLIIWTCFFYWLLGFFDSSLFSGSAWRNTQTYAGLACFNEASNIHEFARCFFAPKLGFDNQHYTGLEWPFFQFIDYLMNANVNVYLIQSKSQLIAMSLLLSSLMIVCRVKILPIMCILLYGIALLDNPTLSYFTLSYQPDLLSIAIISASIAVALVAKKNHYFPEMFIILGFLIKPQHAIIGASSLMFIRLIRYEVLDRKSLYDLFFRVCVFTGPVFFTLLISKLMIELGVAQAYPVTSDILGGYGKYGSEVSFSYYIQMFLRNGVEFLYITAGLLLIAITLKYKDDLSITVRKSIVLLTILLLISYTFTYFLFLTGFIINKYYGSVIFLAINILMMYVLYSISWNIVKDIKSVVFIRNAMPLIILVALVFLSREGEFYDQYMRDRTKICQPIPIREFIKDNDIHNVFVNGMGRDPTVLISLNIGENLWYQDFEKKYNIIGSDGYYFSCEPFTSMLEKNETNFFKQKTKLIYQKSGWSVWKIIK